MKKSAHAPTTKHAAPKPPAAKTSAAKSTAGKSAPAKAPAGKLARPITKRQLSRHQRDLKLQRLTKIGFAGLIALVVLIVGFGYWQAVIQPGGEAILRVRGVDISTQTYAKVLGWRQFNVDVQMGNLRAFAENQARTQPAEGGSANFVQQYVEQQLAQLQQQRGALEGQVIEELINDELFRQEATKRGVTVSPADIEAEIVRLESPAPTETPAAAAQAQEAGQPAATPAVAPTPQATPQPTAVPRTPQQIMTDLQGQLNNVGLLTMDEYRELIVKPQIFKDRVQTILGAEVPATQEQVWARHILFSDETAANDALAKLKADADFSALAKEQSTDTSNKDKGGDLGWFTRGAMVPEFENAAFGLQPGQIVSAPVKSDFGYHVIQLLGRDQNRPLTEEQMQSAKDSAVTKWLQARREERGTIEYGYSWERIKWARDWVTKNAKYLKGQAR